LHRRSIVGSGPAIAGLITAERAGLPPSYRRSVATRRGRFRAVRLSSLTPFTQVNPSRRDACPPVRIPAPAGGVGYSQRVAAEGFSRRVVNCFIPHRKAPPRQRGQSSERPTRTSRSIGRHGVERASVCSPDRLSATRSFFEVSEVGIHREHRRSPRCPLVFNPMLYVNTATLVIRWR
jgi:hypothetical protein